MEPIETTGKTIEEAIDKALAQLGVGRDAVEIVVVDKGRSGVFGIGAGEARVRVQPKKASSADVLDIAKQTIETLLGAMGVSASVALPDTAAPNSDLAPEGALLFQIDGEDAGLLIGRRGETLGALQFAVNQIVSRKVPGGAMVSIDVEGYRARRAEQIKGIALRMAERVANTGRSLALEPMPARERRLVHVALTDHAKVVTESSGEGENRRVVIQPKPGVTPAPRQDRPPGPPRQERRYERPQGPANRPPRREPRRDAPPPGAPPSGAPPRRPRQPLRPAAGIRPLRSQRGRPARAGPPEPLRPPAGPRSLRPYAALRPRLRGIAPPTPGLDVRPGVCAVGPISDLNRFLLRQKAESMHG
ncbi:MAG: protein jag [Chloroflexi bacterium]|nr:protein jag [Chloroflexota bacterium]